MKDSYQTENETLTDELNEDEENAMEEVQDALDDLPFQSFKASNASCGVSLLSVKAVLVHGR